MELDLHIHSNLSDGLYSPEEVVRLARETGLETISLTDHDCYLGDKLLKTLAELNGIRLIRGVEFSAVYDHEEMHILGYFPEGITSELERFLQTAQADRQRRILEGINNLKKIGIELSYEEVNRLSEGESIGRSHLARLLVERGYAASALDAFQDYLKYDHNIVPQTETEVKRIIAVIRGNNGIAIWAHPPMRLFDKYLAGLMEIGLQGIEAYNCKKSKNNSFYYHTVAEKLGLLITAGSDWHGLKEETFLTKGRYPPAVIDEFIKYFE